MCRPASWGNYFLLSPIFINATDNASHVSSLARSPRWLEGHFIKHASAFAADQAGTEAYNEAHGAAASKEGHNDYQIL